MAKQKPHTMPKDKRVSDLGAEEQYLQGVAVMQVVAAMLEQTANSRGLLPDGEALAGAGRLLHDTLDTFRALDIDQLLVGRPGV